MSKQTTSTLFMVRPRGFGYNAETARNNSFQQADDTRSAADVQAAALKEFDDFVAVLRGQGVHIDVFEDTAEPQKPDALFPNNWISIHENGSLITYPLFSQIRRAERREDVIQGLMATYDIPRRYSLEQYEDKEQFLESTGSMVLDRVRKKVYACLSPRTNPSVLDKFCALMGYDRLLFNAEDQQGAAVYHTNVMMSLGENVAVVCWDSIASPAERSDLEKSLQRSGRDTIAISMQQMEAFAGNMLEVRSESGQAHMVMSSQAYRSLTTEQIRKIKAHARPLHSPLDTIEKFGGGSARCMLAEIFAARRAEEV